MATKKLSLLEYLTTESWLPFSEGISTLLVWGLVYIILLTLLSFAFSIQTGDQADYYDPFLLEEGLIGSIMGHVHQPFYQLAFSSAILNLLRFHQYVRSHIGEKRPDDIIGKLTGFCIGVPTTRFYRVVFYFWL